MEPSSETMRQAQEVLYSYFSNPGFADIALRELASRGLLRQADAVEHSDWRGWTRNSEVTVEALRNHAIVKLALRSNDERFGLGLSPSQAEQLAQTLAEAVAEARRIDPAPF